MKALSPGRLLVSAVALWAAFGSYVFDWNATHIHNPHWPPHAKFHNAQTMLLGTSLGLSSLWLLWVSRRDEPRLLRVAALLASLYWLTQMGAALFPGTALVDPEFAHPGQPPAQLIVDAVMLTLLTAGYGLESRRLDRNIHTLPRKTVESSMKRTADHPIDPQFTERWSSRAMSGEPVGEATMRRLFEAARWAPSSANLQPWRFVYARAQTPAFASLLGLLYPGNHVWCSRAGALVMIVAKMTNDAGEPARTHLFDTGAAWMSLALQGARLGLVVHAMGGFDHERARSELGVPDDHAVAVMVAVGHPGPVDELPEPLRAREKPSDRKHQESFVFEGSFARS